MILTRRVVCRVFARRSLIHLLMAAAASADLCSVCKKAGAAIEPACAKAPFHFIACTACSGDFKANTAKYDAHLARLRKETGIAEAEFEIDYTSLVSADSKTSIPAANRLKLGQTVLDGYVKDITECVVRFVTGEPDNKIAFVRSLREKRVVYRTVAALAPDPTSAMSKYQQMFFEAGKLIVQSTPERFRLNTSEIEHRALETAFDKELEPAPAAGTNPKENFALPLRVRKDFRVNEPKLKSALEAMTKALGGVAVTFECDYLAVYQNSTIKADAKTKLGTAIWGGYATDFAGMITNFCSGANEARNRDQFLVSCSARAIVYRCADTNRSNLSNQNRYQQMFFESGRLIVQSTGPNFRINMNDCTARNLEFVFDDQIGIAASVTAAAATASGATDVKSSVTYAALPKCPKCGVAATRAAAKFCDDCGTAFAAPVAAAAAAVDTKRVSPAPTASDVAAAGNSDPKSNPNLPLRTRNDFAKNEPKFTAALTAMQKALGDGAFTVDCNFVAIFSAAPEDFKWNLGSNTYDGIIKSICEMITNSVSGSADLKNTFIKQITSKVIVFRFGIEVPTKVHAAKKYQHVFVEGDKLIVQSEAKNFRINSFELDKDALTAALI